MSNKSSILYPEILVCRDFTDDPHWKDIIYSCACNKFPKGVKYDCDNHTLRIRYDISGKITFESILLPDADEERYYKLIYIFRDLLHLRSDIDIDESRNNLEIIRKRNEINLNCEWKKLKPRSIKNIIIMNFVVTEIDKINPHQPQLDILKHQKINSKKCVSLFKLIQLGIQFKQISSDHIKYKNGVINYIKGLEYNKDQDKFVLTNTPGSIVKTDTTNKIKNENSIEKCIDKWVNDYLNYSTLQI